jgi:hypothetical protein
VHYRGNIAYAAQVTRPDIALTVGVFSKFNNNHGKPHWTAVKGIVHYLQNGN